MFPIIQIHALSRNRNITKRWQICSKLTIETPERRYLLRSGSSLLNFHTFFQCFYCWLWTSKCLLGPFCYYLLFEHQLWKQNRSTLVLESPKKIKSVNKLSKLIFIKSQMKKKNQISRHAKSSRKLILIQTLLQSLFFLLIFTLILFFIGVEKSKYHRFHVNYFWYVNFMKSETFWNAGVLFLHFLGQFTSKIQRCLFKVKFGI